MGSEDRAASPIHRRCIGDASPIHWRASSTSAIHGRRRRGANRAPHRAASAMRRRCGGDPPTPSAPAPSRRPRPSSLCGLTVLKGPQDTHKYIHTHNYPGKAT
eukprot:9103218-Pyramimonas_sp.AAC.1